MTELTLGRVRELKPGTRVRVSDVFVGVVSRVDEENDEGQYPTVTFEDGSSFHFYTEAINMHRKWAKLEPEEPTAVNAVVLARLTHWPTTSDRMVLRRTREPAWAGQSDEYIWADLKDITVLHPGGLE